MKRSMSLASVQCMERRIISFYVWYISVEMATVLRNDAIILTRLREKMQLHILRGEIIFVCLKRCFCEMMDVFLKK